MNHWKYYEMRACQARARSDCSWHAIEGSDLCGPCMRAEEKGETVRRIPKPAWDREGKRISNALSAGAIVADCGEVAV